MNDYTKELEKQFWNHQTNHLDSEKFATAIVQECADIIYRLREPHGNEQVEYALFIAEKRIRDRFGI